MTIKVSSSGSFQQQEIVSESATEGTELRNSERLEWARLDPHVERKMCGHFFVY